MTGIKERKTKVSDFNCEYFNPYNLYLVYYKRNVL